MKIALVVAGGADPSGVEDTVPCLLWLIERLVRAGDTVHVFCLNHGTRPGPWLLAGATVHNAMGTRFVLRLFSQILAEHRRAPFDVVHTAWSIRANLVAIAAAKLLGAPVLLFFGTGELAALPDIGRFGRQLSFRGRLGFKLAVAGADRVAVQSGYLVELARRLGLPTTRMPLGVALDRWPQMDPRRRMAGAPARLLHVGHITPVKDHGLLLDAMAGLHAMGLDFELDVVGIDVAGDGRIARRAGELGLADRIRFHGFLHHQAMRPLFEKADLLIMTSRYEAGPLVVLEAAVAGVPVVGTNVGHLTEWAPMAARVVEPRDGAGLAAIIAEVLADDDLRMRLAIEAQSRALAENADVTTEQFRKLYQDMATISARA